MAFAGYISACAYFLRLLCLRPSSFATPWHVPQVMSSLDALADKRASGKKDGGRHDMRKARVQRQGTPETGPSFQGSMRCSGQSFAAHAELTTVWL